MGLTRYEQETIVNFNEDESKATVYTYNRPFIKKLRQLSNEFAGEVAFMSEDQHGGVTYIIPKKWVKISAPRVISERQREVLAKINSQRKI